MELIFMIIFVLAIFGAVTFPGWKELIEVYTMHDYHNKAPKRKAFLITVLSLACIVAFLLILWLIDVNVNSEF